MANPVIKNRICLWYEHDAEAAAKFYWKRPPEKGGLTRVTLRQIGQSGATQALSDATSAI